MADDKREDKRSTGAGAGGGLRREAGAGVLAALRDVARACEHESVQQGQYVAAPAWKRLREAITEAIGEPDKPDKPDEPAG